MRHVCPLADHIPIVILHFPTGCTFFFCIFFLFFLLLFSPPQKAGKTLTRRQLDSLQQQAPPHPPEIDLHIEYDDGIIETGRVTRVK